MLEMDVIGWFILDIMDTLLFIFCSVYIFKLCNGIWDGMRGS